MEYFSNDQLKLNSNSKSFAGFFKERFYGKRYALKGV